MNKRQKVRKRLVPNASVPKTILEEESDEDETESDGEEEQVPLQGIT